MRNDKSRTILSAKIKLVAQGSDIVMIPVGEVPILSGCDRDGDRQTADAINFIRCGCPSVTIYFPYLVTMSEVAEPTEEKVEVISKELELLSPDEFVASSPRRGVIEIRRR